MTQLIEIPNRTQRVFTCECGEEYLAVTPLEGTCPLCPLVKELAEVQQAVAEAERFRVVIDGDLNQALVDMNLLAAGGYRVVQFSTGCFCDCEGCVNTDLQHLVLLERADYDQAAHAELLERGDQLYLAIEAGRLKLPQELRDRAVG